MEAVTPTCLEGLDVFNAIFRAADLIMFCWLDGLRLEVVSGQHVSSGRVVFESPRGWWGLSILGRMNASHGGTEEVRRGVLAAGDADGDGCLEGP